MGTRGMTAAKAHSDVGCGINPQPERQRERAHPQRPQLAQAVHDRAQQHAPHHEREDADVGEDRPDRRRVELELRAEIERQHRRLRRERQHADPVDPEQPRERRARMADRGPRRVPHRPPHRCRALELHPRLRQPAPGEPDVEQAERGRHQTRRRLAQVRGERADHRPERHPRGGRGGEPAQRLRPLARRHGVGHVGLRHRRGAAARALNEAGEEQQPETLREPEHDVGDRRRGEPDQQRGPAPVAVGDPPPDRRRDELGDGERRDEKPDDLRRGLELEGIERQQREHDHEADHVHEVDRDENGEPAEAAFLRRRHPALPPRPCPPEPSANTAALTSISTTPYAAATPTSACRRLERISSEIGRVS